MKSHHFTKPRFSPATLEKLHRIRVFYVEKHKFLRQILSDIHFAGEREAGKVFSIQRQPEENLIFFSHLLCDFTTWKTLFRKKIHFQSVCLPVPAFSERGCKLAGSSRSSFSSNPFSHSSRSSPRKTSKSLSKSNLSSFGCCCWLLLLLRLPPPKRNKKM